MPSTRLRTRITGAGMLCALAGTVLVVWALYHQSFTPTVNVTLLTDRAGLMMAPQDEVKFHGVTVGDVSSVSTRGQSVAMTLRITPSQAGLIPANAVAKIVPNTVFGNKYIGLSAPASGARGSVRTGTVLVSDNVATEVNTVFGNLVNVLNAANPEALDAALSALATALQGQGPQLGQFLSGADSYLTQFNPSLPQLNSDISETAQVSELYADVAQQFFQVLSHGDKIGATVVDNRQQLSALLQGVAKVGATGTTLAEQNGQNVVAALRLLEPTSSLLNEYSPELTCFIDGEAYADSFLTPAVGGEGANALVNILPGKAPYTYPENLPQVNVKAGPNCYGLPYLGNTPAPFYQVQGAGYGNVDNGTSSGLQVGDPSVTIPPLTSSSNSGTSSSRDGS